MIPAGLKHLFAFDVQARGERYAIERRVTIERANSKAIIAAVRGTSRYRTTISASRGAIEVDCDCPYALDSGPCKHLWALLCVAERNGSLATLLATAGRKPSFLYAGGGGDEEYDLLDDWEDADGVDEFDISDDTPPPLIARSPARSRRAPPREDRPAWRQVLDAARDEMRYVDVFAPRSTVWPEDRRLAYIVDLDAIRMHTGLPLEIATQKRARDGTWGVPKRCSMSGNELLAAPDPADRQILQMLLGASPVNPYGAARVADISVQAAVLSETMRLVCGTGRCYLRIGGQAIPESVRWDDASWRFAVRIIRSGRKGYALTGVFLRDGDEMPLAEPAIVHIAGFVQVSGMLAPLDHGGAFALLAQLRRVTDVAVSERELKLAVETLGTLPRMPPLDIGANVPIAESRAEPVPCLSVRPDPEPWRSRGPASMLALEFAYGDARVPADDGRSIVFDSERLTLHHRHPDVEASARRRLLDVGVREEHDYAERRKRLMLARAKLRGVLAELLRSGWHVDVEGARYRHPGTALAQVRSGIDWFDLEGSVEYGDLSVPLADLVAAHRRGEEELSLADGSVALLPSEWLERLGPMVSSGETQGGAIRFRRTQAALLDALLATLPEVDVDQTFARARDELRRFEQIVPADPPDTFRGALRAYQREALGWFEFLRRFGFGGCLADDMGLGKTVQVLALLEQRRLERAGPSLVVVPRSLVFNWVREAERFAPALRVADHSRPGRATDAIDAEANVVLTTYGTLRRDAPALATTEFDYVILDEAQAIKNAGTASAKAARLVRGRHRLALTGTPIENRLEELWSLFEFLNPGMLGSSSHFARFAREAAGAGNDGAEADQRMLLARALRPVILRRTKAIVATELPARIEQTIHVELEPVQRKYYERLRTRYRDSVMTRIERGGLSRARMHVLEALLRLRQAACHPALVERDKTSLPSAKLDALIPTLAEVAAEGHKVLVFSQFTSLLALVRNRLDAVGLAYTYLDGKTRDRQARVDRFERDATCPVFLISLKAGGHGLNLTAADYVYLLDPWWNPAVEAQAIDRSHRIGQTRQVIATRLVAAGTVEEKILELQANKRSLADAILSSDASALARIGRAEIELLLGP